MNNRSKEIIEDAISQGKWTWLEIDVNSNSLYLEFENLKLSSRPILDNSYRGELAIRFGISIRNFQKRLLNSNSRIMII